MSSDPESISSGMSLPQWMKNRIEKSDLDGIAFSPPAHDESFFYIRYPVKTANDNKSGIQNQIADMLHVAKDGQPKAQNLDFSKHTEPCKRYLQNKEPITSPVEGVKNPPKSFGTDDGFKGAGAACGSSIVKVAQQMVSGRSLSSRGFTVANIEKDESETESSYHTKTIEDQQHQTSKLIQPNTPAADDSLSPLNQSARLMVRRGSKSLPASPLGSPKSMRKYQPNPYFTGSFALSGGNTTEGRGWFLSSLLGIQREATSTTSVSHIEEEPEEVYTSRTTTDQSTTNKTVTDTAKDLNQKVLKAKPSELREMNFWSPTSM